MRRALLSSVAAIALAFGTTAATAQSTPEPRRGDDQSQRPQTDQLQRNQSSQTTGQSQNTPSEQRGDQSNQQGARQGGQDQQGAQSRQQTGSDQGGTQGQSQQGAREPAQGQNRQDAQAPQQTGPAQGGTQGQSQQGAREPAPGQNRQDAQAPRQGSQDSQSATRQSNQPDTSGRIELGEQQQTRIGSAVRQQKIEPLTSLNFSVSVGAAVPSSVRLTTLSQEMVDVLPQYRGLNFFVAQREVVIVDPQSYRIVAFVPLSGGGTVGTASSRDTKESSRDTKEVSPDTKESAAPPASPPKTRATRTERKRVTTTEEEPRSTDHERRAVHKDIDKHRSVHTETDETVGSSRPESVEIEELPPRAGRMGPPVRRYRHSETGDGGPVVVDPGERRPAFPLFPLFDIFR
jgi:hypothetical protein